MWRLRRCVKERIRACYRSKLDRRSYSRSVERWKRSAWILRRSLAMDTFAAWVARHDGVTCGHVEKGDASHWWVMKGRPLRRPLQQPWRAAWFWMMHIPLPQPHDVHILLIFQCLVKLTWAQRNCVQFLFIRFHHFFLCRFLCRTFTFYYTLNHTQHLVVNFIVAELTKGTFLYD